MDNSVSSLSVKRDEFSGSSKSNSTYSPRKIACLVFVETWSAREDGGVEEGRGSSGLADVGGCESRLATKVESASCRVVDGWEVEADTRGVVGSDEALCRGGMKFFSFWWTMLPISVARCVGSSAGFAVGASLRSPSCRANLWSASYSALTRDVELRCWARKFPWGTVSVKNLTLLRRLIALGESSDLQDSEKGEYDWPHGVLRLNSAYQIWKAWAVEDRRRRAGSSKLKAACQH